MRFSNAWAAASISGELCCVVVIPFIPLRAALNSGPRRISELDLLAKNQGHIASGVLQQLLARNTGLGAKLQTLHQVNERTASHLGRGCASQAPRLHLLFETFRENISGCGEALGDIRTDLRYSLRLSQCCGGHHATAVSLIRSGVDGSLAKGGHSLVDVGLRLKCSHSGSSLRYYIALDRLKQQGGLVSEGPV